MGNSLEAKLIRKQRSPALCFLLMSFIDYIILYHQQRSILNRMLSTDLKYLVNSLIFNQTT